MGERVLITGGMSAIGRILAVALAEAGHSVTVWDLYDENAWQPTSAISFLQADIRDPEKGFRTVGTVDTVVHLAHMSMDDAHNDLFYAYGINILGLEKMMTASLEYGVRRFVFAACSPEQRDKARICLNKYPDFEGMGIRYPNFYGDQLDAAFPFNSIVSGFISSMPPAAEVSFPLPRSFNASSIYVKAARVIIYGLNRDRYLFSPASSRSSFEPRRQLQPV